MSAPRPLPRPTDSVDPALEAVAARLLEQRRGRPAIRPAPAASSAVSQVLAPLLKDQGVGLADLKRRWPEIVGEKLAQATSPDKIVGDVLIVVAAGAIAPFVQHQAPLILDRCKLAGAKVAQVAIRQGSLPKRDHANVRPVRAPLAADQEAALAAQLAHIADPALKAALLRLGRAFGSPSG